MSHNQRLIVATIFSIVIISLWQKYYVIPNTPKNLIHNTKEVKHDTIHIKETLKERNHLLKDSEAYRIKFNNNNTSGSINLKGARIDDLILKDYDQTLQPNSPKVELLSPSSTKDPYFITIGWVSNNDNIITPDNNTIWSADNANLTPQSPIIMSWKSPQNVVFSIKISLDKDYMFTIEQSANNHSSTNLSLRPYTVISRGYEDNKKKDNMVVHNGGIGVIDGKLHEITFNDLIKDKKVEFKSGVSWFGFSDKYWLTAMITDTPEVESRFTSHVINNQNRLQADLLYPKSSIGTGSTSSVTTRFFAGAKNLDILQHYQQKYNLPLFERAVDFGVLYFITKPIFLILHEFDDYTGNFGVAILLLTVLIKLLLFPIAYKGYVGMNKMRALQPMIAELKNKYKDDSSGFQKAIMNLYKKEKVNPAAGCLPILLQMPVFFALYKVLSITIEMRQAPFFGWIHDLSAPDPTSIFNLFGLLPWNAPSFLMIGVYPIIMAVTMYIQQRLNPEPADPTQAKVMRFLPLIFLFMFSSFPSGLVIYWAWSNVLSIIQQLIIKKMTA